MKRCFALCFAASLAAQVLCAAWDPGEPVTTYWGGPGFPGAMKLSDAWLEQLKEGGFNTVWATTVAELDLAAKHGMRVIYKPAGLYGGVKLDDPAEREKLAAIIGKVKNHPALYVYELSDEPSAKWFAGIARIKEFMHRLDPNHAAWVNLLPIYANNKQLGIDGDIIAAYWEHVRLFGEVFRPEFITYDHYQFNWDHDGPEYLRNLGIVRHCAASRGIPFFNGVQSCSFAPPKNLASPPAPRAEGPDGLRFLVYTTAAHGAHGIYYFVYCLKGFDNSIVTTEGKTGENYEALKTLNREFIALSRELRPLKFVGAYLQGVIGPGTTPWCEQALLTITPETPRRALKPDGLYTDTTLVSRFDAPDGRTRLMVVNLDYTKERTIHVTAPTRLERFDALSGVWSPVGSAETDLALPKGGGVLLRFAQAAQLTQ